IAWLGVWGAGALASAVYAAIGASALVLSGRSSAVDVPASRDAGDAAPANAPPGPPASRNAYVVMLALRGFLSVSHAILWFRILATATVNTVYVFATLLSIYLAGLVVGALLAARWLELHRAGAVAAFVRVELAISVAGVVTFAALGRVGTFVA